MDPKNVLFIMSDEHDPRHMGAYGSALVRTPALDRLAARGTRFTNAYTPSPICVPARASFATGRHVHDIRYWDNAIAYDGAVRSWGHRLQEAGMRHDTIGKLHYRREEDPLGIDNQFRVMHIMDGIGMVWGSVKEPLPEGRSRGRIFKRIGAGVSNYNLYDRGTADEACKWLKARSAEGSDQPWVLYLGFVAPHFPFVVPREYLDHYPVDALAPRKLLPRDGYVQHEWIQARERFRDQEGSFDSEDDRLLAIASYFGLCTFIDAQVGMVLDALHECGMDESTRVVYTSDHGDNLGQRGLWGKSVLYQESSAIPMIVAGPDIPEGKVCSTPVSLVDSYQSILDGVGMALTDEETELPGRSMFEVANEADEPERPVFSEYHAAGAISAAFMLRIGRYKYHYYVGYAPELFDLQADPEELTDLASDPAHAQTLADFERRLREMLDPEAVDRQAKDDQAALIERFGGREAALSMGTPGATPVPGLAHE